jgi:hypothetical protein
MEPEGSLPCLQGPSTGPYPEPDQSSPYQPTSHVTAQNFFWRNVACRWQVERTPAASEFHEK